MTARIEAPQAVISTRLIGISELMSIATPMARKVSCGLSLQAAMSTSDQRVKPPRWTSEPKKTTLLTANCWRKAVAAWRDRFPGALISGCQGFPLGQLTSPGRSTIAGHGFRSDIQRASHQSSSFAPAKAGITTVPQGEYGRETDRSRDMRSVSAHEPAASDCE